MAKITKNSWEWYKILLKIAFRYVFVIAVLIAISFAFASCKETKKIVKTDINEQIDSVKTEQLFVDMQKEDTTKVESNYKGSETTIKVEFEDGETINLSNLLQIGKDYNENTSILTDLGDKKVKTIELTQKEQKSSTSQKNGIIEQVEISTQDSVSVNKDIKKNEKTKDETERPTYTAWYITFLVVVIVIICLFFGYK